MTSQAQNKERAKRFVLCFRYLLHSSVTGGGVEGAGRYVALAFFGDVQGLATQGSCSKGVQPITSTLVPPDSKNHIILFVISNFSSMQSFGNIDPVCIGFIPTKVLCVPICSWGRELFSEAGPQQPH